MNRARNQFLSSTTFSVDQNGTAGRRYSSNCFLQLINRGAASDDVVERISAGGIAAECLILAFEF